MTTIILLAILAYVWVAAIAIMYELDAGDDYWGTTEWLTFLAFPLVLPVAYLFEALGTTPERLVKKAKAAYRDLIDWLKGKYPL